MYQNLKKSFLLVIKLYFISTIHLIIKACFIFRFFKLLKFMIIVFINFIMLFFLCSWTLNVSLFKISHFILLNY